ncbi:MAG: sugar transferase [Oscillospiraceae bacterium]|nr:sugar transferase [Oscillospiraceae bacterium]
MLTRWDDLPEDMRVPEVRPYYDILKKKTVSLFVKRLFDITLSLLLIIVLALPMMVIALLIKTDSEGPVMYRQERVTRNGRVFRIHKFRTMVQNADKIGTAVTVGNDPRITRVGNRLRKVRLDELPQLFDVLVGDMSFVGTRPEAVKYVNEYLPQYKATLLLPAGITSEASLRFKDEDSMLEGSEDPDRTYIEDILPQKMKYNLEALNNLSLVSELKTMIRTVFAVMK